MNKLFPLFFLIFLSFPALSGCSSLLYHPTRTQYVDPNTVHLTPEDVWLNLSPGSSDKIHVWYLHHHDKKKDSPPKALLLFFHGNGENITSHYMALSFILDYGYDFAIFDYRGYGDSAFSEKGGKPSPKSTVEDGIRFLKWGHELATNQHIPWVIYAQSLGGAVALRSLIETKSEFRPDLAVVDSTFASYEEEGASVLSHGFITWPFQWLSYLVLSDEWAPGKRISEISPTPLWVIHGNADRTVDYSLGREIYHLAKEPKEFWHVEGGHHIDSLWAHEGQFRRKLVLKLDELFAPGSAGREDFHEYGWSYTRQNETPVPDQTYVYTLPYLPGQKFEVLQGFGGSFSHQGDGQYSIDFKEPEGTPVCAIRDGEVLQFRQDSNEGGPDTSYLTKANFILVRHEDGTVAEYYHLKKDGVTVKVGQRIKAGDLIGYSGQTGFTSEPHLHVAVYFLDEKGGKHTVPIVFDTSEEPALRLEQGDTYERAGKRAGAN